MKFNKLLHQITQTCHNKIHEYSFLNQHRVKPCHFTRNRKFGFVDTILFIISGIKNSLQAGLNYYLDMKNRQNETYTKQAFSKGRQRLQYTALKELSDTVIQEFYKLANTKTFHGYHLLAIDGSKYNLPSTDKLKKVFNVQITRGAGQPQALGTCMYDIQNGMIIDAQFEGCRSNERTHAAEMIKNLDSHLITNPIYIMDQGYPSGNLLELISKLNQHYIVRCNKTFLKGIKWNGTDTIVKHRFKSIKSPIRFRIITITLNTGENEYLLTNLFDEEIRLPDFSELYNLRWSIETKFSDLKVKMQIENFTGNTPISIYQDFFATLYLANLAGVLAFENRDEIESLYNTPEKKHKYKLNINMTISVLKQNVIKLLSVPPPEESAAILTHIALRLQGCVVPVRPGRSAERKRKHTRSKFPQNGKLP